jgi:hypothetical protein
MTKIKMVKCLLRSPGEAPAVRFIPLKEFQLWKYYMTHAHEKIVEGEEVSVWIDARSYAKQPPIQARPLESVLRIDLQYWDSQLHTVAMIQRYFPLDEYVSIREVFLRHYPDVASPGGQGVIRRRFVETRGYYIQPRLPELPAEPDDELES